MEYKITDKFTKERIDSIVTLEKENKLTASELVERAKLIDHPWHDVLYKQNNKQAAYLYRLQRAREIINKIKVIINNTELYAYENVRVRITETEVERQYVGVRQILDNEDYRSQVLQSAVKELICWKHKYAMYKELGKIFKSIEQTEKNLFKDVI